MVLVESGANLYSGQDAFDLAMTVIVRGCEPEARSTRYLRYVRLVFPRRAHEVVEAKTHFLWRDFGEGHTFVPAISTREEEPRGSIVQPVVSFNQNGIERYTGGFEPCMYDV